VRFLTCVVIIGILVVHDARADTSPVVPDRPGAYAVDRSIVPVSVQESVTNYVRVAYDYWKTQGLDHDAICPNGVAVGYYWEPVHKSVGLSIIGTCRAWLEYDFLTENEGRGGQTADCMATIHEVGHALGLDHSTDPSSPMYPELNGYVVPLCDQFRWTNLKRIYKKRRLHGSVSEAAS